MGDRGWLFGAALMVTVLIIVGCDGDGMLPPPNGNGGAPPEGFDATTWDGLWLGQWNNATFGSQGPVGVQVDVIQNAAAAVGPTQNGTANVTVDLDGPVFGQIDPDPIVIGVNWDGEGATGSVNDTQIGDVAVSVNADSEIQVQITDIPGGGIESVTASGSREGNTISSAYLVNFAQGGPANGTVSLQRQ